VVEEMELLEAELRIAMFCSGCADLATLRNPGVLMPLESSATQRN
jgi:isopentenyl diphosphate isomerase/L-lactate dehydrogenase-like FMN-dependent dehydrogenase